MKELEKIKNASALLRLSSTRERNSTLHYLRELLLTHQNRILAKNQVDVMDAHKQSVAFVDRLTLSAARIEQMAASLEAVERLRDPIGEVAEHQTLSNGLEVSRVRAPLGVIFMIYESRPNVSIESFSLALKSSNALILKGGKESQNTVSVLYGLMGQALTKAGLPSEAFWGITQSNRKLVGDLLKQKDFIDVVVPRGGADLINFVVENAKMPIIKNDRGMCHLYVDSDADLEMALQIAVNAKTQRPGVCNAVETLLVHRDVSKKFLEKIQKSNKFKKVEFYACKKSIKIFSRESRVHSAKKLSFDTEYLDLKLNVKVVEDIDEAIIHIAKHGSKHSEVIVTRSRPAAERFIQSVDAAATYWNASSRFTDGFELGLGGELGISTQKLHVRGPVGLKELTSLRWVMRGKGQVRS